MSARQADVQPNIDSFIHVLIYVYTFIILKLLMLCLYFLVTHVAAAICLIQLRSLLKIKIKHSWGNHSSIQPCSIGQKQLSPSLAGIVCINTYTCTILNILCFVFLLSSTLSQLFCSAFFYCRSLLHTKFWF